MARKASTAKSQVTEGKVDEMEEVRTRFDAAKTACQTLYDLAGEDIEFVTIPGKQWDKALKTRRRNRPCYEFPKLPAQVRQVLNEMRQGRPQLKIRGVGEGDGPRAELMQGLCRNIESVSNADLAYDIAYAAAVKGGMGCWRICTDYANQDDFDLDIFIKPILNWRSVKFDPAAVERDRRDAMFAFVEDSMSRKAFEKAYPEADVTDFFDSPLYAEWRPDNDKVRIAEYWYKKVTTSKLLAVTGPNGATSTVHIDEEEGVTEEALVAKGYRIVNRRNVDVTKVYSRLTNGAQWLSEEVEFPSKFIPIIVTWGDIDTVDGEDYWQGMVRPNKDQQRLHNVHRTAAIEAIAKAPKSPFVLKPSWIAGYEHFWKSANAEDYPYLPLSEKAPDGVVPQRTQAAEVPMALIQMGNLLNDDIKASTGQYDASLGQRSNETSGKAINARKLQGATSTFNYIDNLAYAMRYQGEILVDMIPRVLDTRRVARVIGEDGAASWETLYDEVQDPNTGEMVTINDIGVGKYDVTYTVGPSFATQRMEAADAYMNMAAQLGGSAPYMGPVLAYGAVKNTDMPGGDELEKILRVQMIRQGLIQPKEGEEVPPMPGQQGPNPMEMAELRKTMAQAASAEADADKKTAEAVQLQLQNLLANGQLAQMLFQQFQAMGAGGAGAPPGMPPGAPPPGPPNGHDPMPPQQPPQGGFLLGGENGITG